MRCSADWARSRRAILVCTVALLGSACTDSAAPLDLRAPPPATYRNAITTSAKAPRVMPLLPDTTAGAAAGIVGWDFLGSWMAFPSAGRVEVIRELTGNPGFWRVRVFVFDTSGALRSYGDRVFKQSKPIPLHVAMVPDRDVLPMDSIAHLGPEDLTRTAVIFRADVPVWYSRHAKRGPQPVARIEFRNLVERAHTLYAAATRRLAQAPR